MTLDVVQQRVTIQLPFMSDSVKILMGKHQADSNYGKALRVYISQCRKDPGVLDGIQKAQAELMEGGFMVPLESLDPETVQYIEEAPFKHYYLWHVVPKEDSKSTPVRLVVDPTMSGLNCVLVERRKQDWFSPGYHLEKQGEPVRLEF